MYTADSKTLSNKLAASIKRAEEQKPELEKVPEREHRKSRILYRS